LHEEKMFGFKYRLFYITKYPIFAAALFQWRVENEEGRDEKKFSILNSAFSI